MSLCYDFEKWTMISLASVAATLIVGLSAVYGQETDNFKTYTNNNLNFTIQHPSNWHSIYKDDCVTFWISGQPNINTCFHFGGSYFMVEVEEPIPYLDTETMTVKNTSPQQYAQQRLDDLSSSPPDLPTKVIRQNEVTIGGYSGWKIEFIMYNVWRGTGNLDERHDQYISEILTIANGKNYKLLYVEDTLKVPETLPLANKMVESFKVNTEEDTSNNSAVENPSNNLTYEEFEKKYCPPLSLVLCEPPTELE